MDCNAFELNPAEIPTPIAFREGGRKHRVVHVFRPPLFADWLEYERLLNSSVEITGGYTRFDQARAEASEALWDRVILRVEGYLVGNRLQVTGNSQTEAAGTAPAVTCNLSPVTSLELPSAFPDDWKSKVPLLHKMAAVTLLAQVMTCDANHVEAYSFDPDQTEVFLDAARGGRKYEGLIHVLSRPSVRQQKEFSRVLSSALYVRGSRTEKSLLPSRLKEMVKFYDELILQAKGYCVGPGEPGAHAVPREEAVKYMDAMHKKASISALFSMEDSGPGSENEAE